MIKLIVFTGFILVALGVLSGCSPQEPATYTVPANVRAGDLTELEACDFTPYGSKKTIHAECGTLTVPENWGNSDSRLITLPVVRIPATGSNPAEPVFFLQGGPGSPNLSWAPPAWLLEKHDVIEVGYRGVEGSVVLSCPNTSALAKSYLSKGIFSDQARAELIESVQRCAEDHQAVGVDLTGYTASGVIKDLEAVRIGLGYDRINLYSVSYGTRLAQIYAYLYPDSLHRVVLIGLNTPGHFIYDRQAIDDMIRQMSDLCANDPSCNSRTHDLAQTMYDVTHNMPDRWLFFRIDPDTVRMGTQMVFFANPNMPQAIDMYLAAGEGDSSGLAMMTLMAKYVFPPFIWGDLLNKGGTLDLELYQGPESIDLGDSVIGSPLSELIWPMAAEWPLELETKEIRQLQESDVDMLVVNGSLDFSTPPTSLDEARPYWHHAQFVLLSEFSHVSDVETLQPGAFKQLITSYYDTGAADDSLFVYQPLSFKPKMSLTTMAKLLVAVMIVLPLSLVGGAVLMVRHLRHR
jgi:pimeloyl-ACP methyl ester carboxylesterase